MVYSVPFCQRRIHSFPKQPLTVYCVTVYPIPLHSTTFYSIPQYSSTILCFTFSQRRHHSLRNRTGVLRYVILQAISLNPQHCPPFHDIPPRSIAFHSAKECSICFQTVHERRIVSLHMPFLSIPKDSTPLPNIPASSTELHCDKVDTILLRTTQELAVVSHSTTFHSIAQHGTLLCKIPPHSIAFH